VKAVDYEKAGVKRFGVGVEVLNMMVS